MGIGKPNLSCDFRRAYEKSGYKGRWRKTLAVLGSQGFQAVVGYRMCHWLVRQRVPIVPMVIQRLVEITTGISISPEAVIGKGLLIMHFGGIVIHEGARIGDNCTITHGVTIGNKTPGGGAPRLGNSVYLCVDAKVLGEITIGDHCVVGAGAVVLKSVPARCVVAGVPARVVKSRQEGRMEASGEDTSSA